MSKNRNPKQQITYVDETATLPVAKGKRGAVSAQEAEAFLNHAKLLICLWKRYGASVDGETSNMPSYAEKLEAAVIRDIEVILEERPSFADALAREAKVYDVEIKMLMQGVMALTWDKTPFAYPTRPYCLALNVLWNDNRGSVLWDQTCAEVTRVVDLKDIEGM